MFAHAHELAMEQAVSSHHWRFMDIGGLVPPLLGMHAGGFQMNSALDLTPMRRGSFPGFELPTNNRGKAVTQKFSKLTQRFNDFLLTARQRTP